MNSPDRQVQAAAMQAPEWTYQAPYGRDAGLSVLYRKVELMAAPGDLGMALKRSPGSARVALVTTVYLAQGSVHQELHLTPQRAIALRNALNDYLADVRQEALR